MNIENLSKAMRLKDELTILQEQHKVVTNVNGGGLRITIQSSYQDDAFVDAIRAQVLAELSKRIGEKKRSLAELGITF